jgi:hypothetical protein
VAASFLPRKSTVNSSNTSAAPRRRLPFKRHRPFRAYVVVAWTAAVIGHPNCV